MVTKTDIFCHNRAYNLLGAHTRDNVNRQFHYCVCKLVGKVPGTHGDVSSFGLSEKTF